MKIDIGDVVKSAMDNDVTFIPLFREAFPYFYNNLVAENPHLTNDEFKFCALLKLGFRTKDIAEYCHFTVRTVQTKRTGSGSHLIFLQKLICIPGWIIFNRFCLML